MGIANGVGGLYVFRAADRAGITGARGSSDKRCIELDRYGAEGCLFCLAEETLE